jgi:epoxide hydrolase-like predicted phosphatase
MDQVIEAVIFDVGGVLIRTPDRSTRLGWERRLGLVEWESEEIVFNSEVGTKAQLGQITDAELWDWIGHRLNLSEAQLGVFKQDFWAGDRLDQELISYILQLRPRYQTAIISNATDALREKLGNEYPIGDAFDLIVVSAEEGLMKPHEVIYQRTLNRLGRSAEEAIFIDDSLENVQAARDLGMYGVHFSVELDIRQELANFGVLVS